MRIRFAKPPRSVDVRGADKIAVSEMVVTFPLPSTGGIWVRAGDRYAYFAKYRDLELIQRIGRLLTQAQPAD